MVDLTPDDNDPHAEIAEDASVARIVSLSRESSIERADPGETVTMTKADLMPSADRDEGGSLDQQVRHHLTRAQILAHAVRLAHLNGWRLMANEYKI